MDRQIENIPKEFLISKVLAEILDKMNGKHPEFVPETLIPPMTHPYGRYWKQPTKLSFSFDEDTVLMSKEAFCRLANYEHSNPTGCYEGKMWRRGNLLVWFGKEKPAVDAHNNPITVCPLFKRKILVRDE